MLKIIRKRMIAGVTAGILILSPVVSSGAEIETEEATEEPVLSEYDPEEELFAEDDYPDVSIPEDDESLENTVDIEELPLDAETELDKSMVELFEDCESEPELMAASSNFEPGVAYHTQDEIRSFVLSHPALQKPNTYMETPSCEVSYSAGLLSTETQQYAINALNQMRYIAGVPADVTIDTEYTKLAQTGAFVNAVNKKMSHSPEKPEGMDDEMYALGSEGAGSSNLACGCDNIVDSVLLWMDDSDPTNIEYVGHRSALLDPFMKRTGFGAVGGYSAVYVFDPVPYGADYHEYNGIAWPAQNMPVEYFSPYHAWSIRLMDIMTEDGVEVDLRSARDGKTWHFSKDRADGYYKVNAWGENNLGLIVFKPKGITFRAGDHFDVTIKGVYDSPVEYSVDFFSICNGKHQYASEVLSLPTCEDFGEVYYYCRACASGYCDYTEPLEHDIDDGVITKPATTFATGIRIYTCRVCGEKWSTVIPKLPKLKKPTIKKPSAKKKQITVKWSHFKHSSGKAKSIWKRIKNVQVQCARDKKFTNLISTKIVRKSKTKTTIKGLTRKTRYYVRVRYFDGKEYSAWSKAKKIRTK